MSILIRPARSLDLPAILDLNLLAFGSEGEGRLIQALDTGGYSRVSLVAKDPGVIGHILFSEIEILHKNQISKALSLAPMCVHPERQGQSIGTALLREGIRRCREMAYLGVFVLGHPEFYQKFGFSHKLTRAFECPYSGPAFMALELSTGSLQGVEGSLIYPEPFRSALA